jgi:anti-sigma regulatory factor (Ser/Thr protein kinase)
MTLIFGTILSAVWVVLLMACSAPISSMFFDASDPAWGMSRRMLLLFPNFLILNLIFGVFTKIYQCQGRKIIVSILTFAETLGAGVTAVLLQPFIGPDGAWLSFSVCDLICIIAIGISVFLSSGKITWKLTDWMRLPQDFGAAEKDCMEFSVHSIEELVEVSSGVMDFCLDHQIDKHRSKLARLSIEEVVGNVICHGFRPGEKNSVDVRIVTGELLTIRIRDDCKAFDPAKYLEQFTPNDPSRFVGLRIIAGIAKEVIYQNNAGINTLMLKV